MGIAMMGFLHIYMQVSTRATSFFNTYLKRTQLQQYTQPLFIQALMGIKNLYEAKTVAIHVLGKKPEGDLKRPFKAAPGMFGGRSYLLSKKEGDVR